jgi:hypothetical protein
VRHRDEYRAALHTRVDQKLVVLTSTWGPGSLLGQRPQLPAQLVEQLPIDEYRVAAIVHPNVAHWHGHWQVRAWLSQATQAGLQLVPDREGWRGVLVAADIVLGDHGSVTTYAAALGTPILIGAPGDSELDPDGSSSALIRSAPALDDRGSLLQQVDQTMRTHQTDRYEHIARRTFANPGQALRALQKLIYEMINLEAPTGAPTVRRVPAPETTCPSISATEVLSATDLSSRTIDVLRFPAGAAAGHDPDHHYDDRHLAVDIAETDPALLESADILIRRAGRHTRSADEWARSTLTAYPGCRITAAITSAGSCLAFPRDRPLISLRFHQPPDQSDVPDETILVSALYAWIVSGGTLDATATDIHLRIGPRRLTIRCSTHNSGLSAISPSTD